MMTKPPISSRTRRFGSLLAVVASVTSAQSAAADMIIDAPPTATTVAAFGDVLAWSRQDATGRFRLVIRKAEGVPEVAPIASRGVPFDVDVGPDRRGVARAVYSRCREEPLFFGAFPAWAGGVGCDLYELNLASGRERRLAVSRRKGSEVLPTIWRGDLAFVYLSAPGEPAEIRYRRHGAVRSRELRGGPAADRTGYPRSLDLVGRNLTFGWERVVGRPRGEPADRLQPLETSVYVHAPIGARRLVSTTRSGETDRRLALPSIFAGSVYYGVSDATGAGRFLRYRLSSKRHTSVAARALRPAASDQRPFQLLSVVAGSAGLFYSGLLQPDRANQGACAEPGAPCRVAKLDEPSPP